MFVSYKKGYRGIIWKEEQIHLLFHKTAAFPNFPSSFWPLTNYLAIIGGDCHSPNAAFFLLSPSLTGCAHRTSLFYVVVQTCQVIRLGFLTVFDAISKTQICICVCPSNRIAYARFDRRREEEKRLQARFSLRLILFSSNAALPSCLCYLLNTAK